MLQWSRSADTQSPAVCVSCMCYTLKQTLETVINILQLHHVLNHTTFINNWFEWVQNSLRKVFTEKIWETTDFQCLILATVLNWRCPNLLWVPETFLNISYPPWGIVRPVLMVSPGKGSWWVLPVAAWWVTGTLVWCVVYGSHQADIGSPQGEFHDGASPEATHGCWALSPDRHLLRDWWPYPSVSSWCLSSVWYWAGPWFWVSVAGAESVCLSVKSVFPGCVLWENGTQAFLACLILDSYLNLVCVSYVPLFLYCYACAAQASAPYPFCYQFSMFSVINLVLHLLCKRPILHTPTTYAARSCWTTSAVICWNHI